MLFNLDQELVVNPANEAAFPHDASVNQPLLDQRNGDEADVSADALNGKRRGFGPGCVAWLPVSAVVELVVFFGLVVDLARRDHTGPMTSSEAGLRPLRRCGR